MPLPDGIKNRINEKRQQGKKPNGSHPEILDLNYEFPIRKRGIFRPGKVKAYFCNSLANPSASGGGALAIPVKGLRGGLQGYAEQEIPQIDTARAKKDRFRTEPKYFLDKFSINNKILFCAEIAQSVEQRTENPRVPSSILGLGTTDFKGLAIQVSPFLFALC
jgi:hypothetical protein